MLAEHDAVTIRPARDNEARACRILLPEMFAPDQSPDLLVAVVDDPDQPGRSNSTSAAPRGPYFAGAAALGTVFSPGVPGLPVMVHVVPSYRRQGIGRALIEAAAGRCRANTDILRAAQPVPADSQAASFLTACGFNEYDQILHFEVDARPFYEATKQLRERLGRSGRIPGRVRVTRLRDAPAEAVADLVCRHFPSPRATVLSRLRGGTPNGYDLDNSVALFDGDTLRGALIFIWNGGLPVIEVRVVDQALRGGWANVLLLDEAMENAKQAGALKFRFFADERLSDTMALARRANGTLVKIERHFRRHIG